MDVLPVKVNIKQVLPRVKIQPRFTLPAVVVKLKLVPTGGKYIFTGHSSWSKRLAHLPVVEDLLAVQVKNEAIAGGYAEVAERIHGDIYRGVSL